MVQYNEEEIIKFKDDYELLNDEIIKNIEEIDSLFENIEEVLETPKSLKENPNIVLYLKDEISRRNKDKELFINNLEYILSTYNEKISEINKMVGDKNV